MEKFVSAGLALVRSDQEHEFVLFEELFGDIRSKISSSSSEGIWYATLARLRITPQYVKYLKKKENKVEVSVKRDNFKRGAFGLNSHFFLKEKKLKAIKTYKFLNELAFF